MRGVIDLTGNVYERLTVVSRAEDRVLPSKQSKKRWIYLCECGSIIEVSSCDFKSGRSKSCGCLKKELHRKRLTKLGMSNTRFYRIWKGMKRRCDNPNDLSFKGYGLKGINYDPLWGNFENFYKDMYSSYSDTLTLDRKDNDKDYSKDNCRWATQTQQARNIGKLKSNTSGKCGVHCVKRKGIPSTWVAYWVGIDGIRRTKSFSVKKLGYDQSFKLASKYRDEQIRLLNEQGAGYSEKHGL